MAVVGGAKISTKLDLLKNLVEKVDVLVIGGAMANTFLAAQGYQIGKSLAETRHARHRQRDHQRQASCCRATSWSPRRSSRTSPCRIEAINDVTPYEMILDVRPAAT